MTTSHEKHHDLTWFLLPLAMFLLALLFVALARPASGGELKGRRVAAAEHLPSDRAGSPGVRILTF